MLCSLRRRMIAEIFISHLPITPIRGFPSIARKDQFISRRHYLGYRVTESLIVRAGRFLVNYGLNTGNHVLFVRRGLGFDQGTETYNLETYFESESFDGSLTILGGRPDDYKRYDGEKGLAFSGGIPFFEGKFIPYFVVTLDPQGKYEEQIDLNAEGSNLLREASICISQSDQCL